MFYYLLKLCTRKDSNKSLNQSCYFFNKHIKIPCFLRSKALYVLSFGFIWIEIVKKHRGLNATVLFDYLVVNLTMFYNVV